jgi:hypothetical protein
MSQAGIPAQMGGKLPIGGQVSRQGEWTKSIAVGSRPYVERVKELLGFRAKGREVGDGAERCQLREPAARYSRLFEIKNDDIGPENTFDRRISTTSSGA